MGRYLFALGLVAVAVGIAALARASQQAAPEPRAVPEPSTPPNPPRPHFLQLAGPAYHMPMSIN
jgi:hypothetical protein